MINLERFGDEVYEALNLQLQGAKLTKEQTEMCRRFNEARKEERAAVEELRTQRGEGI